MDPHVRAQTNAEKVRRFMREVGRETSGPGRIYLTGGATAVLVGWRDATVDIDLKADPEPTGLFEAIARLKEALDLNVELAAPDAFIPPLPGWRERSRFIDSFGAVQFFHYDLYSQALAKIERGHARDLRDVHQMLDRGLIEPGELRALFQAIVPGLVRYPSVEPSAFREKLEEVLSGHPGIGA